jgi:hypothetical protein
MNDEKRWARRLANIAKDTGAIGAAIVTARGSKQALAAAVAVEHHVLTIRAVCPPELVDAAIREVNDRARASLGLTLVQAYESVVDDLARGWLPPEVD